MCMGLKRSVREDLVAILLFPIMFAVVIYLGVNFGYITTPMKDVFDIFIIVSTIAGVMAVYVTSKYIVKK